MANIDTKSIKESLAFVQKSSDHILKLFLANAELDKIAAIREQNLEILFDEAKKYRVRYLYVGKGELAGCENKKQPGGSSWPAIWAIAEKIGFPGSCGNKDQYQCQGSEIAFPESAYGGWDLETNTKLSDEETEKLKFNRVVTGKWRVK